MSAKKAGGSAFFYEVTRIRNASESMREYLGKLDGAGPALAAVLIAKIALQLTIVFSALDMLERIGREAKADRVQTQ